MSHHYQEAIQSPFTVAKLAVSGCQSVILYLSTETNSIRVDNSYRVLCRHFALILVLERVATVMIYGFAHFMLALIFFLLF